METFYRAVGILCALLASVLLVAALILLRRVRPIGALLPLLSALLAAGALALYLWASGARVSAWLAVPALGLGLAAGAAGGLAMRLQRLGSGGVQGRLPPWLVAAWCGAWALALWANLGGSAALAALGLLLLLAGTGAQVGFGAVLFVRRLAVRPRSAPGFAAHAVLAAAPSPVREAPPVGGRGPQPLAPMAGTCPACGQARHPGGRFCARCGAPLAPERVCPACGTAWDAGTRFCGRCGAALG